MSATVCKRPFFSFWVLLYFCLYSLIDIVWWGCWVITALKSCFSPVSKKKKNRTLSEEKTPNPPPPSSSLDLRTWRVCTSCFNNPLRRQPRQQRCRRRSFCVTFSRDFNAPRRACRNTVYARGTSVECSGISHKHKRVPSPFHDALSTDPTPAPVRPFVVMVGCAFCLLYVLFHSSTWSARVVYVWWTLYRVFQNNKSNLKKKNIYLFYSWINYKFLQK